MGLGLKVHDVRAPRYEPEIERASALPTNDLTFDVEVDVAVVGGGCAGLASAIFNAWNENRVILLEKAYELGGTTVKSAFWYWVPNNGPMREAGQEDREEDFLRYAARISRPEKYDPNSPTFGASEWEFALYKAIYESTWPAVSLLHERGALRYRWAPTKVDYHGNVEEDRNPTGRVLIPEATNDSESDGGFLAVNSMAKAAAEAGVDIRCGWRVQRLVVSDGAVVGVVATNADGQTLRVGARKAVVFGSGGFTHDQELRENFLSVPALGGCAARTNQGDFVRIGSAVGAQLRNMQYAWRCSINLSKAVRKDPHMQGCFLIGGDGMILVNYKGKRAFNEKLPYNDLIQRMYDWDPVDCEFPNRVMVQIWDARTQDIAEIDFYGNNIVPEDVDRQHYIQGDTLEELAANIAAELDRFAPYTGDCRAAHDFLPNLKETIARWNELARNGVDEDFHRGERPVELVVFGGPVGDEPEKRNPVMYPISDTGPYYATLITGGTLDTKGGPKITPNAEVVDDLDRPIPGLYGVGNCVAAPQARAYWAGGSTLGPMIGFAYRASQAIARVPARDLGGALARA